VAKVIATVGGIALKPGMSANRRIYSHKMIADAVRDAQERIAAGESLDLVDRGELRPLAQLTHHGAEDDSTRIVGRITGLSLDEDGNARFSAALADTDHGRTIANLLDTADGQPPFLKGGSIRGFWKGTVRKIKGPDGRPAETADGLELDGLDYTRAPGVAGAGVDTFAWADRSGRTETTERVAICESILEARVSVTEELPPVHEREPDPVIIETLSADSPAPHILENGICITCAPVEEAGTPMSKRTSGTKGVGGPFADPGYQADKKQRYQLDTKAHARAALAFISKKGNAAKYTSQQLKRVKSKIMAACRKFGISVATESDGSLAGWVFDDPGFLAEQVAECMGCDPAESGSYCLTASNGPTNISISDYRLDPSELDPILRKAVDAACAALKALDPDMDGDVDVPGAPRADTDHDGAETAPEAPGPAETGEDQTEETGPAADPAAAKTEGTEDPAMAETTNPAEQAPDVQKHIAEGIAAGLAQAEEARRLRKAAKRAARETAGQQATTESTAAAQRTANVATATGTPAPPAAVAETEEQRRARLAALVEAQFAQAAQREGLTETKTDEQLVAEMIEERLVPMRQAAAERGGVNRKGVVAEAARQGVAVLESIGEGAPGSQKMLQESSNEDLAHAAAAAYGPRRGAAQ
jgi:hypothetical protein